MAEANTIIALETGGWTWEKTADLRWNLGNPMDVPNPLYCLEQKHRCLETGEERWERVPIGPRHWKDRTDV